MREEIYKIVDMIIDDFIKTNDGTDIYVDQILAITGEYDCFDCPECSGKGWRPVTKEEQRHLVTASKTICPVCNGSGKIYRKKEGK